MKNLITILGLVILLLTACEKEKPNHLPPNIRFVTENGFVFQDTTLKLGEEFKIGIHADNPNVNLTNFIILVESNETETFLDSGMNTSSLNYEKSIVKGIKSAEKWSFIIRDRDTKSSEVSLTINLDTSSSFGSIRVHQDVELGAQNNAAPSFYSLHEEKTYSLEEAFQNQNSIDLCYYYDFIDTDENSIASPGANIDESVFPGEYGLSNWTTRRTSRFKSTDLTEEVFNSVTNDSLLIAVYGLSQGNRKAKNLQAGDIFSFQNEDGKVGLILVNTITGIDAGSVIVSIKVQE